MPTHYVRQERNLTIKRLPEELRECSHLRLVLWETNELGALCVVDICEGKTDQIIKYFNTNRIEYTPDMFVSVEKAKHMIDFY